MKAFKIGQFFFLMLMLLALSCASQKNLSKTLSESKNDEWKLSYADSSGKVYYSWGDYSGQGMIVIFKNVEFNKKKNLVKVEGITTVFFNNEDTIGLCCVVDYFIAQPINGYLTNIRRLGQINSKQIGDTTKPDGYFSFEIILNKKDRLCFVNTEGGGLQEYNIGKVCFLIK